MGQKIATQKQILLVKQCMKMMEMMNVKDAHIHITVPNAINLIFVLAFGSAMLALALPAEKAGFQFQTFLAQK
jgi:hypothetical protein